MERVTAFSSQRRRCYSRVHRSLGRTALHVKVDYPGGSGLVGGAQTLLRTATAAVLNSVSVNYPLTQAQVISQVNAALASNDRDTMLALAATLNEYNNLDHSGCPQ